MQGSDCPGANRYETEDYGGTAPAFSAFDMKSLNDRDFNDGSVLRRWWMQELNADVFDKEGNLRGELAAVKKSNDVPWLPWQWLKGEEGLDGTETWMRLERSNPTWPVDAEMETRRPHENRAVRLETCRICRECCLFRSFSAQRMIQYKIQTFPMIFSINSMWKDIKLCKRSMDCLHPLSLLTFVVPMIIIQKLM